MSYLRALQMTEEGTRALHRLHHPLHPLTLHPKHNLTTHHTTHLSLKSWSVKHSSRRITSDVFHTGMSRATIAAGMDRASAGEPGPRSTCRGATRFQDTHKRTSKGGKGGVRSRIRRGVILMGLLDTKEVAGECGASLARLKHHEGSRG